MIKHGEFHVRAWLAREHGAREVGTYLAREDCPLFGSASISWAHTTIPASHAALMRAVGCDWMSAINLIDAERKRDLMDVAIP